MKEKILVAVKTYPTLSKSYKELVCTAGVNEQGDWRRIFPVPFRRLNSEAQYKKYQWIEADIEKSTKDGRPESYEVRKGTEPRILGDPLSTKKYWDARRPPFLDKVERFRDLSSLIEQAHRNERSLALYEPGEWIDFTIEPEAQREWEPKKLAAMEEQKRQLDLFKDEATVAEEFTIVRKLPYRFKYRFCDAAGKIRNMMVEDWEIGALYWNCLKRTGGDEAEAVQKVREKYWDTFVQSGKYDTTLVVGTTLQHHNKRAPNPFVIISVVPVLKPPDANQVMFDF